MENDGLAEFSLPNTTNFERGQKSTRYINHTVLVQYVRNTFRRVEIFNLDERASEH